MSTGIGHVEKGARHDCGRVTDDPRPSAVREGSSAGYLVPRTNSQRSQFVRTGTFTWVNWKFGPLVKLAP
jgi:hypothetical protein